MNGSMTPTAESLRRQALRQARTRALAGRARAATRQTPMRPFLVCTCGGDRYGLPLSQVSQVLPGRPITAVPGAPAAVLGAIAVSGRVLSVLALARALGRSSVTDSGAGHLVILRGSAVALAVDRVEGLASVAVSDPDRPASGDNFLDPAAAGLSTEAVSGYAPARAGAGDEPGFVAVDLPCLLRRYLP
jgi:purine-binding chemotaxis protein CheW